MKIDDKQIKTKKKIGDLEGDPVYEIETKGGLYLDVVMKKGKSEILSTGSHRAISRHIALKDNPGLTISELSKSEQLPEEVLQMHLPEFLELTRLLRDLEINLAQKMQELKDE